MLVPLLLVIGITYSQPDPLTLSTGTARDIKTVVGLGQMALEHVNVVFLPR